MSGVPSRLPAGTLKRGKFLNLLGTGLPQHEQKLTLYPFSFAYDETYSVPRAHEKLLSGAISVVEYAEPLDFLHIEQWH